jgi:phosphopantetheine adenylyltransferase
MTRRFASVLLASAALAVFALSASAHEGHDHKVMGTISMIHDLHLEVKDTDGKATAFTLNEKTKILRGTTLLKTADVTVGTRVVVTAEETKDKTGKAIMIAKEVRLGENAEATARK